jgi:hypothetical protein
MVLVLEEAASSENFYGNTFGGMQLKMTRLVDGDMRDGLGEFVLHVDFIVYSAVRFLNTTCIN